MKRYTFGMLALLLGACGGSGDGGNDSGPARCVSVNPTGDHFESACTGCEMPNPQDANDGSLYTFADIVPTLSNSRASIRAGRKDDGVFPPGSRAGAFVTLVPLADYPGRNLTINLYLDGVLLQTADEITSDHGPTHGRTDAQMFFGMTADAAFDAVEVVIPIAGNTDLTDDDLRIYEICADADY